MLGLYYAILGLASGAICSFIANKNSLNRKDWFTVGQILPGVSILLLLYIARGKETTSTEVIRTSNESVGTPAFADSLI